jgi:hypothetical protein
MLPDDTASADRCSYGAPRTSLHVVALFPLQCELCPVLATVGNRCADFCSEFFQQLVGIGEGDAKLGIALERIE